MSDKELTKRDIEFFDEVTTLINTKYPDMKNKFGLWRDHQHFAISADEVFHETSDSMTKESTLRIIKKSDLPEGSFASTWRLTNNGPVVAAWCCDDSPVNRPGH